MKKPILVLQMQRMGDLILSFPLFLWLERTFPGHPIRVVAEPVFFRELAAAGPAVQYVSWAESARLAGESFHLTVNLSHRPEAAALAGQVRTEELAGPYRDAGGATRIRGDWQLYRASLVHNNRHNQYHWADLNALDVIPLASMARTRWEPPQHMGLERLKAGLFLGASQAEKRPDAAFWAGLARELYRRGMTVILLGGPGETALGRETEAGCKGMALNACGKMSLAELAYFSQHLALCVTPDTGPMHLFSWTGRRVLNLSMGPVSPFETGPYQPGRHVLRARMSCRGCWACHRERIFCKERFTPEAVGYLAWRLARGESAKARSARLPGLELLETAREARGLYDLRGAPASDQGAAAPDARRLAGDFWAEVFGVFFGLAQRAGDAEGAGARAAWGRLAGAHPAFARAFSRSALKLSREMTLIVRGRTALPGEDFWRGFAPHLRPLTGYLNMRLHNEDFSPAAFKSALELLTRLAALMED